MTGDRFPSPWCVVEAVNFAGPLLGNADHG
jgi:hypothetical protein